MMLAPDWPIFLVARAGSEARTCAIHCRIPAPERSRSGGQDCREESDSKAISALPDEGDEGRRVRRLVHSRRRSRDADGRQASLWRAIRRGFSAGRLELTGSFKDGDASAVRSIDLLAARTARRRDRQHCRQSTRPAPPGGWSAMAPPPRRRASRNLPHVQEARMRAAGPCAAGLLAESFERRQPRACIRLPLASHPRGIRLARRQTAKARCQHLPDRPATRFPVARSGAAARRRRWGLSPRRRAIRPAARR